LQKEQEDFKWEDRKEEESASEISGRNDLFREILRDEAVARLNELGKVSDADGYLERTFTSPASLRAGNLIRGRMEDAGLRTWVDHLGNLNGQVEGMNASAEALLIGSHLDTVVDAGIFDGSLGIISALSALKVLNVNGTMGKLRRPIEGVSAALAGVLPVTALQISDKSGVTVKDALKENSLEITEENLLQLKYDPGSVWGYIEVHIEQGPVLERLGFPLGVVKGIAGQTRLKGHAGTVPMSMRQDPMAAAAELIVLLESACKNPKDFLSYDGHCNDISLESLSSSLVCTVGERSTWPSASNVIPGQVTFTVDLRAIDDMGCEAFIYELSNQMYKICERRSVSCIIDRKHDANAVVCDSELSSQLKSAAYSALRKMAGDIQDETPALMSGAGHDAMALYHLTKVCPVLLHPQLLGGDISC
ncbi:allantoate deiminase 2, partial [Quercus suber]